MSEIGIFSGPVFQIKKIVTFYCFLVQFFSIFSYFGQNGVKFYQQILIPCYASYALENCDIFPFFSPVFFNFS